MTENDSGLSKPEADDTALSAKEQERLEAFQDLIQCILELDPKKYAQPWTDEMLISMRALLTKSVNSFPKKARPIIQLFRKFLFDNGQLIAMAATAHAHAASKQAEKESLIVKPSFSDLGKIQAEKR